jgi:hypothetical protein
MSKRTGLILFLALALAFLALNRAAYQGYFTDDEIDAMAWTRWGSTPAYIKGLLTPLQQDSFRAVGFYYFHVAEHAFGSSFPKYVAVIHAIHLLNVWILWLLMRRLGAPPLAAGAACVFFALHMALFDAVWKPMFVFDVLCCAFCLASLLLWARGNWILSFAAFWLAYKSKELAVMLPVVLVCYELWFGNRRWTRLAPFAAAALCFGLQALILAPTTDSDYVFHFTRAALARTAPFYASRIFLVPYLGFLLPLGAVVARNRRTWFGLAMMLLFLTPLLWLPGRVLSAYCYLPFAGLAIATAGLAERAHPAAIAACFLLWLPVDIHSLRLQRNDTLRQDQDAREWMTTFARFVRTAPPVAGFIYYGVPEGLHDWGMESAAKYFLKRLEVNFVPLGSPEADRLRQTGNTAICNWDYYHRKLDIQTVEPSLTSTARTHIPPASSRHIPAH